MVVVASLMVVNGWMDGERIGNPSGNDIIFSSSTWRGGNDTLVFTLPLKLIKIDSWPRE